MTKAQTAMEKKEPTAVQGDAQRMERRPVFVPATDVYERDDALVIVTDMPGVGEKEQERDEKKRNYHLVERTYGSFQRSIPLPGGLLEDKAKARFKNGVLTITIPKSAEAKSQRKQIPVATE